jgi:hypothetical protein
MILRKQALFWDLFFSHVLWNETITVQLFHDLMNPSFSKAMSLFGKTEMEQRNLSVLYYKTLLRYLQRWDLASQQLTEFQGF